MSGRMVEILPPTTLSAGGSALTYVTDVRFALPTERAKSGRVIVNMFGYSPVGLSGAIQVVVLTATDWQLDPNQGTPGSTPAFWIAAHAGITYGTMVPQFGTKTDALTTLGEWLRLRVTVPVNRTCRLSVLAMLYDA